MLWHLPPPSPWQPRPAVAPAAPCPQVLPAPSQLVEVTLERPLGLEFEEDARRKRVVVSGFTPGGRGCRCVGRALPGPMASSGCTKLLAPDPVHPAGRASPKHALCAAAGGHAEQVFKKAKLNPALLAASPMEGDVLRACTATNIVYPAQVGPGGGDVLRSAHGLACILLCVFQQCGPGPHTWHPPLRFLPAGRRRSRLA